jgi:predicted kinase
MTKEEYIRKNNEDIDKMSIEDLRAYTKRIDANAQTYFHNWQKAESQNKKLTENGRNIKKSI